MPTRKQPDPNSLQYNSKYTAYVYTNRGDIYLHRPDQAGTTKRITETVDMESAPVFSFNETRIVFNRGGNLYSWEMSGGAIAQLTHFQQGSAPRPGNRGPEKSVQEKWLQTESLANSGDTQGKKREKRIERFDGEGLSHHQIPAHTLHGR